MKREIIIALRMTLVTLVLTGLAYPLALTGLAQVLFPARANGSLATAGDRVVGSELIGQRFRKAGYFQGRPSAAGTDGYDAISSSGSNLGPTSTTFDDSIVEYFEPGDAEDLARSIVRLYQEPARRAQLARNGRARQPTGGHHDGHQSRDLRRRAHAATVASRIGQSTGALLIPAGLAAPGPGRLDGARAGLADNAAREGRSRPIDNDHRREKADDKPVRAIG